MGILSTWMYCHTSISVQFDSGNTRMLSPGRILAFRRFHSSGRWRFGSHWPFGSRTEKMRSLERVEQRLRFQQTAAALCPDLEGLRAFANRLLVGVHDEACPNGSRHLIAELDHFP